MDEITKAVQEKYIDDITSKYPLHRLLITWIYLTAIYSYINSESSLRMVNELSKIKIPFLFDIDSGLLSQLSITHLLLSMLATSISAISYSKIKKTAFNMLAKTSNFEAYINDIQKKIQKTKSQDQNLNFFISKDISVELKSHREKIKSMHSSGETLVALLISLLYGSNIFIAEDYFLVITILATILITQFLSFKYYISKFIPYYVAERSLLGANITFGDD